VLVPRIETSPKKVQLLTALLLVGVFAAGNVTGAGLCWWLAPAPYFPRRPTGMPGPFGELGLSKENERKVIQILEKHRPELEAVLQETFPKARLVFDKIDKEVSVFLTPEQRKKLEQFKQHKPPFPPMGFGPHRSPFGCPPGQPGGSCESSAPPRR
jgi:hypothetical protein